MSVYGRLFLPVLVIIISIQVGLHAEVLPSSNPNLIAASGLTALTDSPANASLNPASGETGISVSTSFLYSMQALNQYDLASLIDYGNLSFFTCWQTLNNQDYLRNDFSIGSRWNFETFRIGIGFKLLYDDIPDYGGFKEHIIYAGTRFKHKQFLFDLASSQNLTKKNSALQTSNQVDFSFSYQTGESYSLSSGFSAAEKQQVDVKFGCKYDIAESFAIIVSWSSEPGRFGFGTVFNMNNLALVYALQTHPELDWTHSVGLNLTLP